jgi:predicted  nucleic acid-binding Zn-ribbon protein
MPRLTVTISDEHERILEEKSDVGEAYRSKSEVVRECIEAHERVEELSQQLACLEAEVDTLREQRKQLRTKAARVEQLEQELRDLQDEYQQLIQEEQGNADPAVDVDDEFTYQSPSMRQRLKSMLFGGPDGNR